jgi:hypothetical protein
MTTFRYKAAGPIRGTGILPLNQLRDRYPDIYDRELEKYAFRPDTP